MIHDRRHHLLGSKYEVRYVILFSITGDPGSATKIEFNNIGTSFYHFYQKRNFVIRRLIFIIMNYKKRQKVNERELLLYKF